MRVDASVLYLLDNTSTYKKAFTRQELHRAILQYQKLKSLTSTPEEQERMRQIFKHSFDSLPVT